MKRERRPDDPAIEPRGYAEPLRRRDELARRDQPPVAPGEPREDLDMAALLQRCSEPMDFLAEQFQPSVFHGIDGVGRQPRGIETAGTDVVSGENTAKRLRPAALAA